MEGYCKTVDNPFVSPTIKKKHVLFSFLNFVETSVNKKTTTYYKGLHAFIIICY